jgi:hypothetical protein
MINFFELLNLVRINAVNGDDIAAQMLIEICSLGLREYHNLGEAKIAMRLLRNRINAFCDEVDNL